MTWRATLTAVLVAVAVPLVMVVTAPPALACSCAPRGFAEQVGGSDVVFSGRVVAGGDVPSGSVSSADPLSWTFVVDRVYKGTLGERQDVVSVRSEVSCGIEFVTGRSYLVLGSGTAPTTTGLCSGTRPLPAEAELQELGPGAPVVVAAAPPVVEDGPFPAPWIVGGVVVVAGLALLAVRRRRSS